MTDRSEEKKEQKREGPLELKKEEKKEEEKKAGQKEERRFLLLVEDDVDDVQLTVQALLRHIPNCKVEVAQNGKEALDFLFGRSAYSGRDTSSMPAMILLDLNMPGMDGFEVLRQIRADKRTERVPVVFLTMSEDLKEIVKGYKLAVNSYIRKPLEFTQLADIARRLGLYWLIPDERH